MDTMKPIIIDWRAPVASMFYSFTGGEELAFYQSPDGLVEGDVYLKRNISIRKRELERVVDTYVKGNEDVSHADDFLLYRLGENKDNKLKDIVSTIQSEQNDIIRAERNLPLLIQGVAGSGKTTIALHRLAFLIYEYREQLEAERMIVFAPNSLFLDYISSVLPELGVGNISQTTFPDWALRTLDDSVKLKQTEEKLKEAFSINRDEEKVMLGKLKGTLEFKFFIEERMIQFENELIPTSDFEAWDKAIIPVEDIKKWMQVEYKIVYEEKAYAFTESPEDVKSLIKQRYRWSYGTLQCLWKHRKALCNSKHKTLGFIALPNMWLFQYVLQFIAPLADILMIMGLFGSDPLKVLGFYFVFFLLDLLASLFAFKLEEENPKPLVWLILQRFIYRQFMTYVVIKSICSSLRGVAVGWNKLKRMGSVKHSTEHKEAS